MCGFVGFLNDCDNTKNVLELMMDRIKHRGPDSDGMYVDDDIALGFRRLSIIDLKNGSQPIFNEDSSLVMVFNGEIYNYRQLREELIKKGHTFRTETDSETIIHGYEEFGEELPNKLRGMFAFVIWDKNNKELFGARDYFGIKPLYYAKQDGHFLFGSEIKSFIPHPYFKRELNEDALESYLSFQYSGLDETFFKGVFRLRPAHYFKLKDGNMEIKRYWQVKFDEEKGHDMDYWVDEISKTFDESVEAHKISDVEVGSFLSSGVDSSYVACRANVDKTFTVGFANEKYNEISYAKDLAKYINVENINKVITPEEYGMFCLRFSIIWTSRWQTLRRLHFILYARLHRSISRLFSRERERMRFSEDTICTKSPTMFRGITKFPDVSAELSERRLLFFRMREGLISLLGEARMWKNGSSEMQIFFPRRKERSFLKSKRTLLSLSLSQRNITIRFRIRIWLQKCSLLSCIPGLPEIFF